MVRAKPKASTRSAIQSNAKQLKRVLKSTSIHRADYIFVANMLLSGEKLSDRDREALSQLFEHLRLGRVKLID
jgi:hypothetical protein